MENKGSVETRPTKTSATTARKIVRDAKKTPQITSGEIQDSLKTCGVAFSRCTIRRHLKKDGLHGPVGRRKPLPRKCHKVSRLQYAKQHRDKPQTFWLKVIWSDETKIEVLATTINATFGEESTRLMMKGTPFLL